MYNNFFGLRESPFNINPDPRFLHRTPRIQEALDYLTYGIQNRKGLLLLTGEVGTGKTTLINHLLDWLRERQTPTAFIFNSHLQVNHLFDFILNDFGISTDFRLVSNMLLDLNQWLLKRFRDGSTPVLIVDEAQGLSFELLEEIRLLLNLETSSEKLLQIVLVGQPELEEKLKRPELRQLRQRIALRCNTAPLTLAEAHGYIVDRLRIAGATREPIFDSDAIGALHYYSRGIPRVMNLLCEHALINAYVEGVNPVPPPMVEEAARDFLMDEFRPLSAYRGFGIRMDSKLSVIHSESSRELVRSFMETPANAVNPTGGEMPVAAIGLMEQNRGSSAGNSMADGIPQKTGSAVLEADLDTPLCVLDLVPASSESEMQSLKTGLALSSSATQSDCAAELAATMGRLLAGAGSIPGPPWPSFNVANECLSASTSTQAPAKQIGPPPVGGRIWKDRTVPRSRSRWTSSQKPSRAANSTTKWLDVSAKVLLTSRETMAAAAVVMRHWKIGFSHDWKVTVDAMDFPQMKKSLLHWFREPLSSKRMPSTKNQSV